MTSLRLYAKRVTVILVAITLSLILLAKIVLATNIQTCSTTFDYNQTTAREMLEPLNEWRSAGASYWNSDNITQTTVAAGTLTPLKWDYNLEKIAMQRAYEIILLADHKCPNGDSIYNIRVNGVQTFGENITIGSGDKMDTYEKALIAWQENDANYAGQGHRRLMLDSRFTAIGIAHVVVGSKHYWVQEYGERVSDTSSFFESDDSTHTVTVEYDKDIMALAAYAEQRQVYGNFYQATVGATVAFPSVNTYVGLKGQLRPLSLIWSNGYEQIYDYWGGARINDDFEVTWTSSDDSVARVINNNKYQVIGTGVCVLTANVNFKGLSTKCDIILESLPTSINDSNVRVEIEDVSYTGGEVEPSFRIMNNDVELVAGTDYDYYFSDNVSVGYGQLIINGKNSYNGQRVEKFEISAKNINSTDITVTSVSDQPFTGSKIEPAFTVFDGTKELVFNTDYTYKYLSNESIGKASLIITGINNYSSTRIIYFNIYDPAAPTSSAATSEATQTSDAAATSASATSSAAAATSASATSEAVIPSGDLTIQPIADQFYDGTEKRPVPVVSCGDTVLGSDDYNVVYDNNVDAGTATVFVSGKGSYAALVPVTAKFVIHPMNITNKASIAKIDDQQYTGEEIKPAMSVTVNGKALIPVIDYTVIYEDNTGIGTAKVTVTGTNNYSGSVEAGFNIVPQASEVTVSAVADQTYTGGPITPDLSVYVSGKLLDPATDYNVSFSGNTNVGDASALITLKGNYSGTATVSFKIVQCPVSSLNVAQISDQVYSRTAIKPAVTVTHGDKALLLNNDYSLSYSSNTNAGTGIVKITGKGNYAGSVNVPFMIKTKDVNYLTVSSIADQDYTGSAIKPAVTVKFEGYTLVSGTDYTVEYKNNINGGNASVVITGKANYSGTRTVTFRIIKFSWKKISGKWYYIDDKGTKATGFLKIDGSTYYFDSTGIMLTGWQKISGNWYYFNSSGVMKTDWQKISKKWYYFTSDGVMATGLTKIGSSYYYFDTSGIMKTGWISVSGKWYYFASGGNAVNGWQKISKKWYYFDKNTCVMATGFTKIDGVTYYFDNSGIMKTKWIQVSGQWYYFNSDGSMVAGASKKIGSKTYNFDSNGVCLNP